MTVKSYRIHLFLKQLKCLLLPGPGAHPTNVILIEFKIRPKFAMLWFKIYSDHNEIFHMSRQLHCRDMCKILLWSVEHILN